MHSTHFSTLLFKPVDPQETPYQFPYLSLYQSVPVTSKLKFVNDFTEYVRPVRVAVYSETVSLTSMNKAKILNATFLDSIHKEAVAMHSTSIN